MIKKTLINYEQTKADLNLWIRIAFLVILDGCIIAAAKFTAIFIRFEFSFKAIPKNFYEGFQKEIVPAMLLCLAVFAMARLYRSLWRYAGAAECINIFIGVIVATLLNICLNHALGIHMFRSYYAIGSMLMFIGVFGLRFSYRFARWMKDAVIQNSYAADMTAPKRIMVVGAGDSGVMIIREILHRPESGMSVRCIIDDDPLKNGRYIKGIKIVGGREKIVEAVGEFNIDEIIVAIPSASPKVLKDILEICNQTDCSLKRLPDLSQIIANGRVQLTELRSVNVEDLLGRETINVDLSEISSNIENKVVMVTGGGGSIGSELCRQLLTYDPKKLVIVDIYENNMYDLQQELRRKYVDADERTDFIVASVRDYDRMRALMESYCPEIVYHAAAHKHVPLMENSPNEAIKNNVFGTYKTAKAAAECGVKRFVLISTDKAVNPTSIMGASKRICEMVIQAMNNKKTEPAQKNGFVEGQCEFVAVRFGNVLASNGSVVKLFEKQIAEGGPVTVTHKDIIRYFMTIPEAVSLVLQAGAYAKGGEIFVLDMGEQVRIDDLARNMIRLSGYVPDQDIRIVYTGLRPGEKLYEETLMAEEGLQKTPNKLIHIGHPIEMNYERFSIQMAELERLCNENSNDIARYVSNMVPGYTISEELKAMADQ